MILTPETYKAHAETCLLRPKMFLAEFEQTLRLPFNISRNISRYRSTNFSKCLRIIINDFVIFFNTFDRNGGVELFRYLAGDINKTHIDTLLWFFKAYETDVLEETFINDLKMEIDQ